jgi:hypothetical protein
MDLVSNNYRLKNDRSITLARQYASWDSKSRKRTNNMNIDIQNWFRNVTTSSQNGAATKVYEY